MGRDTEDDFHVNLSISCDTTGKMLLGLTKQQLTYLQNNQVTLNLTTESDLLMCPDANELMEYRVPESVANSPLPQSLQAHKQGYIDNSTPLPNIDTFLTLDGTQVIPNMQDWSFVSCELPLSVLDSTAFVKL